MSSSLQLPGYQLQKKFAEGGMASIYLGKQISLGRSVAIKVLNLSLMDSNNSTEESIREAFEAEAVIISRLNHPHIVQVIDRGITADGIPYFVMEYIKGVSLSKAVTLNTLTLQQRYKLALQICQAIAYAHKNRVIHRDIKPDNILVDMQGNAKILDFGIALLDQKTGQQNNTLMAGTARYMAPELMTGETQASAASDIFSLGFVLYELFSGLPPSPASVVNYRPLQEINPQLPMALDKIIQQCLHSRPDARPANVQHVINTLLELSNGDHLGKEQRQRAQQVVGKRNFVLLDVLQENEQGATYLFEEKNNRSQMLVKKYPAQAHGFVENKRLMGLEHKHIVPILGASKNDRVFVIVTPYLSGGNLQDRLVRQFSLEEFAQMARQICSAMSFAHQNGIYHRHLSANSILFDDTGTIQIADFSLDPIMDLNTSETQHKKNDIGAQIDLRNAGLLFYHILTGEPAIHKGEHIKITNSFKQLPDNLQEMVKGMLGMTYKPFNSFAEIQAALDAVTDSLPTRLFQQQKAGMPRIGLPTAKWLWAAALAASLLLTAYFLH